MDAREQLEGIATRLERLALEPHTIEASGWLQLARPLMRLVGWQPHYRVERVGELLVALRDLPVDGETDAQSEQLLTAIEELTENLELAERACAVNGRVAVSQLAWMQRLTRVLGHVDRCLDDSHDNQGLRLAAAIDPLLLAPPLTIASDDSKPDTDDETAPEPSAARLVELQLSAIDHIIDAARAETSFIERRRRLLEAARRLLLDADASLRLDQSGARLRKRYLTEQIALLDRAQGAGLSARVSLLHQARSALSRGKRHQLHCALVAMEGFALGAGDAQVAERAGRMLAELEQGGDSSSAEALTASLERSAREIYGEDVHREVEAAYRAAREDQAEVAERNAEEAELAELATAYLAPGAEHDTLSAMLSVDGLFDVGAPLCPVRVSEAETVARLVPFPTEELLLSRARNPADLPGAMLADPRTVLMDLASGRLLTRKFVQYEERIRGRTELLGEARVYLLDGSTSMMTDGQRGARARMRDAILVAELATLLARFRQPQRFTRVVLFYRYFTKVVRAVQQVSDVDGALAALGDVLGSTRRGGTDIERALCSSFETIRSAQGNDPNLAQAQIVLITDGKAVVRERAVQQARERVGEMRVGVSVIALGEENKTLRRLVARQRALGERAFYHFVDDDTLAELCDGKLDQRRALHLFGDESAMSASELSDELGSLLQELVDIERSRHLLTRRAADVPAGAALDDELAAAMTELGLDTRDMADGRQALLAASERDRRTVLARYHRWFPEARPGEDAAALDAADVTATLVVLATVAEVLGELGGDELTRKADAVDIVERLLPDARLSPERLRAVLWAGGEEIDEALAVVHQTAAPRARD